MTTPVQAQIVTFRLGDDLFAADIYEVERVLRYSAPTPIPNVPGWIEGVIDYHGRVVPVINLRHRFEMPAAPSKDDARILVFNVAGEWIAATVDGVLDVSGLDDAAVVAPPRFFRGIAGEYLRGLVRRADRLVIVLDAARLLSTAERLVLDQSTAGAPAAELFAGEEDAGSA
jgi:purine-binding chemotaxis protein CheW